jgi:DNA repair protein RAD50
LDAHGAPHGQGPPCVPLPDELVSHHNKFLHYTDPRQSGTKQTKAAVKLRFTSRNGQPTVILRSMELTQNKTTLTFKQLDGVIRTQDESGKRVALSHKCSELDSQVPVLLGTSKAILDSVLFCHQEESNWPLQEGAVLKKKFDDIFDS